MKCPVCANTNLMMTERSGIEIDYCPQCRGVWLDRGELDKIIERANRDDSGPTERRSERVDAHGFGHHQGQRKDHDHDRDYRGHHHKKSFWNELFD